MHLVKVTSLVLISYCLIGLIHAAPPQATEGDGVKVNNNNEVKDFVPSPEVDPSSSTKFIPFCKSKLQRILYPSGMHMEMIIIFQF